MKRDELDLLIKNGFLQAEPDKALTTTELNSLVHQGFLEELPNHFFTFHNNLTWEVIYETLLYAERRLLHNIIAIHIEKHHNNHLDNVADLLLYHFEQARNFQKCVSYGAIAGDKAASMFANEEALSFYGRSMTALDHLKKAPPADRSLLHEHIGDVNENTGNHKEAFTHYQTALDIWRTSKKNNKPKFVAWKLKPSIYEAFLARKIAMSLEHDAEYDKALQWLDEAEKLLPNRPGRLASQLAATRSAALYRKSEFKDAITWGEQALKLAKQSGSKPAIAYAHNVIANPCMEAGKLDKAITHLRSAEEICIAADDFPGIASANHNLGNTFYAIGRLHDAINHFNKALNADELMHNNSGITMSRFNLGNILVDTGDISKSIEHLQFVLDEYEKGKSRRDLASASHMILSRAHRLTGNLEAAAFHIDECMKMLKNDSQSGVYVYAELQYAELLMAQNNTIEALEICERIYKLAKEQGAKMMEVQAARILGQSKAQLHDYDSAIAFLKQSIELANSMGIEHEEALSIIAYTKIALNSQNVTPFTIQSINRAISMLTKIGAKLDLAEAKKLATKIQQ
ncbi:MAG: tetratricopeptide repeat protein [Gammaproteobacteria bacterium]|nr:tetratricopeptide repeat protein [Gammaproteobacteria bacterium]